MTASTDVLEHIVYNVFLPPKLPQKEQEGQFQRSVDLATISLMINASQQFRLEAGQRSQWSYIQRMLERLYSYTECPIEAGRLGQDMRAMQSGDILCLHIEAQNAGLIIRKQSDHTTFEVFEVQAQTEHVMSIPGKIVRNFPGPAIQLPNSVAGDCNFINEVANILCQMNVEIFDAAYPKTRKAGADVRESRDSINPNYFIQFFFGFLRGLGESIDPPQVTKRLGDEVLWMDAKNPWRRSPIWLIIRIALQSSLDSNSTYKHFMVYYHASILSECYKRGSFSSELFHVMRVKMARRLYKVRNTAPQFLIDAARDAVKDAEDILQGRWSALQSAQAQSINSDFSGIDFDGAINQTLPQSRSYLEQVFRRHLGHTQPSKFHPKQSARLVGVTDFSYYANGGLSKVFATDPDLALFDFEASVFKNLTDWTGRQTDYTKACATMSSCFQQYLSAAKCSYTVDAADQSIMILTLIRIWVAIDEMATRDCPLLHEYPPELPENILDSLLLRTTEHIAQARVIQEYIHKRYLGASSSNPSIFSDQATSTCFAVRFFNSSPLHQQLKARIEEYAEGQKSRKIQQLNQLNAEYDRLSDEISSQSHLYIYTMHGREKHSKGCRRCSLERKRGQLSIQPYEWPLPSHRLDAEAVVFELSRPGPYVVWRDITYTILIDLGTKSSRNSCQQYATLETYSALGSWLSAPAGITSRVTIASSTKSFNTSHYNDTLRIPASQSQVCLNNGLQFKLYDSNDDAWAAGPFSSVSFAQYGTLEFPNKGLYRHLKYAFEGTSHSSNQVLADQHDCPKDLSLHEHIAFGSLRSGARLQWMNITRGLEEDLLTFNAEEVGILHTQAAWQVGPLSDDGSREWHGELEALDFGNSLVLSCKRMLVRVKANWLQATSVSIIVTLVCRLLASSPAESIVEASLDFLREARDVAHDWLDQLKVKLQSASDSDDIINYQLRVSEMAAICRATYNVEPHYIERLLSTTEDYIPLVKSSVCLYDNALPNASAAPRSARVLLARERRFAHKVATYMLRFEDILSKPLSQIWPDYRQGTNRWEGYKVPNDRWITTTTEGDNESRKQEVHFNLLSGQLLIDGKPLGRLPRQYVEHETYIRLFGQKILEVVPAKSKGMEFTTRDHVYGYQVSFTLKDDKRLIIQARKDDRLYELVPHSKLTGDFPLFFSEDYHHWADVKNHTVEFRPLSTPWSAAESQWLLHFNTSGVTSLGSSSDGSLLIDVHSAPFKSLSSSIGPLESGQYIHVTRSPKNDIEIELPRMRLSFFINEKNQLESRNFRGQVLDENQSAGTLIGLKNQLLLRAKGASSQSVPGSRSILIPDGGIQFNMSTHHTMVSIHTGSSRHIDVYRYKIDNDLNQLATDAGLTSRLVKIYLHALTSHCLPDPLTGRTGTEEALHLLSQASSSSFEQINLKQAGLLKSIGLLTPTRKYYPAHLHCMQTTHWANLPALSQHFGFSSAATEILQRADTLQLFSPLDFQISEYLDSLSPMDTLQKRAARRSALYYPSDTTGNILQILDSSALSDSVHLGRDNLGGDWSEAGQAASWAAGLVHRNWGLPVYKAFSLVSMVESWDTLQDSGELTSLTYRSSLFKLDLSVSWIAFYNLLRNARTLGNKYILSVCLAGIAFGKLLPKDLIPVFLAFATNPEFSRHDPPTKNTYQFSDGYKPKNTRVKGLVSTAAYSVESSPAGNLTYNEEESYHAFRQRRQQYYDAHSPTHQSEVVKNLIGQWSHVLQQPNHALTSPSSSHSAWINVSSCRETAQQYFSSCSWNVKMKAHLQNLEHVLASQSSSYATKFVLTKEKERRKPDSSPVLADPWSMFGISEIMCSRPAPEMMTPQSLTKLSISTTATSSMQTARLASLFAEFNHSLRPLNCRYGNDLEESRQDLNARPPTSYPLEVLKPSILDQIRKRCSAYLAESIELLKSALGPQAEIEHIVACSGVWSRVTSRDLLQQISLRNRSRHESLPKWKDGLIAHAQLSNKLFAAYQKSQRLIALADSNNIEEFYKEFGLFDDDESGMNDPDWLLVQIDGNFGARSVQRQVAREMISPISGTNTVLQLNMGEGKSSVIVPIIASALADSSKLVRVIVLKPLWRQMFELLVSRLSGLCNRKIYYLPFGRHLQIDLSGAQRLRNLYEECMREGGILLAQPEHILSFKLMGIDRLISSSGSSNRAVANSLRDIQSWLKHRTRDILDESDEILHVRYQLVYTTGDQQPLDDHPDRWTTTQQLLRLAAMHAGKLHLEYPDDISYTSKAPGQFPVLRIMPNCRVDLERRLILAVAADVKEGRLMNLNCDCLKPSVREILVNFFASETISYSQYEHVRENCDLTRWKGLLLIRGLLASGILVFALKRKHYRVDYGLDLSRSLLAVPYRAKDLPSLRAEFGHPDVAVVLTCLSYYYQGLTSEQLDICFELLFKLDNPTLEYEQWVQRDSLIPDDLRQLNGVNIKDRQQFTGRLVPIFSHNSATVDFYLSSVVFPKEAKEFPEKLGTSGWDLAERKHHVTTGFSGTNDNRYLLPTSISQADPVKQLSTNALVLTYLLQPENNHYICMRGAGTESLTTEGFLRLLVAQTPEVRVLLDVGAQMLELQNEELVRCWLGLRKDIEAAVYFNDRDELVVLPQSGTPSLLNTSPFAQRLDKCIVYLDDGHTRGTDLKLPRKTRAMVTLGPKVTKDRLLQGCMRMRKLGHGQSVIFAAPPEIDTQIRNASPDIIQSSSKIDALDVLRWAMLETCKDLQHHVSHWAQQGIEYDRRHQAEQQYERSRNISVLQKGWTTPESRPLEEMYGVLSPEALRTKTTFTRRAFDVPELRRGLDHLGVKKLDDPSMDEEQEREVNHEVEREQETQRPPKEKPASHSIHPDVKHFVTSGELRTNGSGVLPLSYPFRASTPQIFASWSRLLFASVDFFKTVASISPDRLSEYMRPVNWILSSRDDIRVVLSPHEVNELLPLIRKSSTVRLHVYAPRVSISMMSFSRLDFYSVPTSPISPERPTLLSTPQLQLDLFAGQLYFECYEDYALLCASLGLYAPTRDENTRIEVGSDGFVSPEHRCELVRYHPEYSSCQFSSSPVPGLKDLVGRRRKGMKYLLTHIGRVLHARSMTPEDF
ncbi:hypothetical protein RHS02_07818, partial [Rhizoctonia solani]